MKRSGKHNSVEPERARRTSARKADASEKTPAPHFSPASASIGAAASAIDGRPDPAGVLALQRTAGNRAVNRLLAQPVIQAKSAGTTTGDALDQQADRVAAQAAALSPPPNQTGLPDRLKTGIEALSGISLDHVRVRYNSTQPADLNALAYAQGSEIHVAPGQERHLPHETWHIAQQAQGRVPPTKQLKNRARVNDDQGLEREADEMGAQALKIPSRENPSDLERGSRSIEPGRSVIQRRVKSGLGVGQLVWSIPYKQNGTIRREHKGVGYDVHLNEQGTLEFHTYDDLELRAEAEPVGTSKRERPEAAKDDRMAGERSAFSSKRGAIDTSTSNASPAGGLPGSKRADLFAALDASTILGRDSSLFQRPLDREGLLEELEKPVVETVPAVRRISGARVPAPGGATKSKTIAGSNQDCVLAAFVTMKHGNRTWLKRFEGAMTADDRGIMMVARELDLQPRDIDALCAHLRDGGRAFVRAPALAGNGWHAYCAFGFDAATGYVMAWDPDNEQASDVKQIPIEAIDKDMIWF